MIPGKDLNGPRIFKQNTEPESLACVYVSRSIIQHRNEALGQSSTFISSMSSVCCHGDCSVRSYQLFLNDEQL